MPESTVTLDDIFALFRESEHQRKEYQHKAELEMVELRKQIERTDKQFELTDKQIELTSKQIDLTNKQVGGLTSRWGEFVENLVKPAAARLFREQGMDVHHTALRVDAQDEQGSMEIDILVENTNEAVAIEVKSHLEVRDVKRFLQVLARFKKAFPRYQNYKLYGAVAGIKIDERSNLYATQERLYVIEPAGDSVIIANCQNLKPRVW